jgi:hypothetical protein
MSSFGKRYPDFATVEQHIRRAQAQRAVFIATLIADGIAAVVQALRRLVGTAPAAAQRAKPLVVKARAA